jgi:hypothetical protein
MLDLPQEDLEELVNIIMIPLRVDKSLPEVLNYDNHLEVFAKLCPFELIAEIFCILEEVVLNLADCGYEANLDRFIESLQVIIVFERSFDEELFAYSLFPADLNNLGVLVQHAK